MCRNGASNGYFVSNIKSHSSKMCSFVYRTINCLTNDNLIDTVNPKIDSILTLIPRVESLIKQVQNLSSQLNAKFDKLPKDFQNSDVTEYSQQLKRTAEAVIVTASTIIESQSTSVGGKDRQQPASSNSGEHLEDLNKRKIEEWISYLTVSHGEREQEYDTVSELTPDDSVSSIGLNINKRSQQSVMPGSSLGADKSEGTPKYMSTGRKNSKEVFDEDFTHSSDIEEISSSGEEESNWDTISENTLTEHRADHKVDTSYDEKSAKELLAVLGANTEAMERNVNDLLLDLAKMEASQGLRSSSNIVGTLLYLLEKGANVNAMDFMSNTPLYYASGQGNTTVVELLSGRNADFNIQCEGWKQWTALHIAASRGHTPVVEVLLKNGVDVEQKTDCSRCTALQLAASEGWTSTVQCLLTAGASINVRDAFGKTPLHSASYKGHVGVADALLKAGASIDAKDDLASTPLVLASKYQGHVRVVEALLKAGASVEAADYRGWTPLIWVSHQNHIEVVETLLKAGASLSSRTEDGETALMRSAYQGHKAITELLLVAGADIRVRSKDRSTVLHKVLHKHSVGCAKDTCGFCAGSETRQDMLELLCEKGADPSAKDRYGESPLLLVREEGYFNEAQQVLREFGAK